MALWKYKFSCFCCAQVDIYKVPCVYASYVEVTQLQILISIEI